MFCLGSMSTFQFLWSKCRKRVCADCFTEDLSRSTIYKRRFSPYTRRVYKDGYPSEPQHFPETVLLLLLFLLLPLNNSRTTFGPPMSGQVTVQIKLGGLLESSITYLVSVFSRGRVGAITLYPCPLPFSPLTGKPLPTTVLTRWTRQGAPGYESFQGTNQIPRRQR